MLTGNERMQGFLKRKPIDRIPVYEQFWGATLQNWINDGKLPPDVDVNKYFGFDIEWLGGMNMVADLDFQPVILEETDETVLALDGNGAMLRRHKLHDSTPEHVDFTVKERRAWEEVIKPKLLKYDPRRIDIEGYKARNETCHEHQQCGTFCALNVFELMHPVCGHEYMLMGMIDDPDWIKDMVETYSDMLIQYEEELFSKGGKPDVIWYYEDMGYKGAPFMSPAMYKELIWPAHKKTVDFAKSLGVPVIMHSCGYVEPLVPDMIRAGIDCLQVIEVKAGMDLLRLYKNYGDILSFMGGMDVRVLYSNDLERVDRELESKIPTVKQKYGYALHSDHSIPNTVNFETYKHFVEYGLELGTY